MQPNKIAIDLYTRLNSMNFRYKNVRYGSKIKLIKKNLEETCLFKHS